MSFILDALKKSENERQRQNGPALFEVKVPAPKTRLPLWAIALVGLLVVNLGVVGWLVLRRPSQAEAIAATPAPVQATAPAAQTVPAAPPSEPVAQPTALPPPVDPTQFAETPALADDAGAVALNPEDYEPAIEPSSQSHVTRGTAEGLPTYEQVAGNNGLPALRLDLHVYAAKPQERFVFVNMRRLSEGDSLPEGVRVDSITQEGAVLSFRGAKFVLERD